MIIYRRAIKKWISRMRPFERQWGDRTKSWALELLANHSFPWNVGVLIWKVELIVTISWPVNLQWELDSHEGPGMWFNTGRGGAFKSSLHRNKGLVRLLQPRPSTTHKHTTHLLEVNHGFFIASGSLTKHGHCHMLRGYSPAQFSVHSGSCQRKQPGLWERLWLPHRLWL